MSTYDSRRAFVVHSDTKRPKVENMERRPVIIKHRTQRRRTSRIARRPARDVWKHKLYEANGKQIIRKCEILKQMTTEARKRIKNLGNMKKGHPKSKKSRTGAPRRDAPNHKRAAISDLNIKTISKRWLFLMCSIPLLWRWVFLNHEWK